jgi:hypothetical protein
MTNTLYHKLLRVSALSLALVLLFASGILSPVTKQLSSNAGSYIATAIGINAAVLPNEVNTLSAQLQQREKELQQREIAVELKESAQGVGGLSTFIMSTLLFVLLVLIILNYVLDFIRGRRSFNTKASA